LRRFVRKHRIALIALAVYHFVFFFPTLFMQRVPSPNDVFSNFEPWATARPSEAQNSLLNDPPTAYFTLMSLAKNDWRAFHWNPYVASGIPGWGSSAAAVLSPFILIPTFALPLAWVWAGIIFLKLNGAFFFAYLWLREERLGKRAAAIGAILFAASGPLAVRWFWQATNATALYPALLWIALRTARGKRTPMWAVGLVALAYAMAGFPAAMAYGAYIAVVYFLFCVAPHPPFGHLLPASGEKGTRYRASLAPRSGERVAEGRVRGRAIITTLLATALAAVIALPSLIPFVRLVRSTGYLPTRAAAATEHFFPLRHFLLFLDPDRLGNNGYRVNWIGDAALGILNNYVEATVYVGLLAIPLLLIAAANRRARRRWFWLAALAVMLACMFGFMPLARVIGALPGFKYSALTRLQLLLPVAVAYLAAAGAGFVARRRFVAVAIAVLAAADLGVFAGRFYPFLDPRLALPPQTPTIAFLQAQPKPFRIAPMFDYLWPNTAEYARVEDIRSHFSSEAAYRSLLQGIDPTCTETRSTVLLFNSLKFNLDDPLVSVLGVRYFIEQRSIDIIRWSVFKATVPGVKEIAAMYVAPGGTAQRHVRVDAEPFWAIELPASCDRVTRNGRLIVSLLQDSRVVYTRAFTPADTDVMGKVYIPLRPYARLGQSVILRVQAVGLRVRLLTGATDVAGDAPIFYGRVMTPVIFDRELPDGRIFRNLGELPRFYLTDRRRPGGWLAGVSPAGGGTPPGQPAGTPAVQLLSYAEDQQVIDVDAPSNALLESSEKLTPELRVIIDGRDAAPITINTLFAAVNVPAGHHRVVFSRRVGRGWWGWSGLAFGLFVIGSVVEQVRRRPTLS
jgi:hypothetical protein